MTGSSARAPAARAIAMGALLAGTGCAGSPSPSPESPEAAVFSRVCSAVVAAFRNGVRPSQVEVEIPGPNTGDPPAHLVLVTPQVPLAEQCLGLPMPASVALNPPAAEPRGSAGPTPSAPIAAPRRASGVDPLDTRN